jgi:transcriptional regulator with XRE-family HTH domain
MMGAVTLGARIRSAREAAGMTQEELANRIHASTMSIKNWEADRREPRSHIGALEAALGIQLRGITNRNAPRLDEATDAQLVSEFNARLAERSQLVRDLRAQLAALGHPHPADDTETDNPRPMPQRWAARAREVSDQ